MNSGLYACEQSQVMKASDLKGKAMKTSREGSWMLLFGGTKQQVYVLLTLHDPAETIPFQWKEKNRTCTSLRCPAAITTYNQNKAGVMSSAKQSVQQPQHFLQKQEKNRICSFCRHHRRPSCERAGGSVGNVRGSLHCT